MITSEKSSLLISFVDEKIQGIAETGKKTLHCPPLLSGHIEFCNPVAGIADVVFVGKTGITYPSPAKAALAELFNRKCGVAEVTIMPSETPRYFCRELPLFTKRFYLLFQFKVDIVLPFLPGRIRSLRALFPDRQAVPPSLTGNC